MLCFRKQYYFEINLLKKMEYLQANTDFDLALIDFGLSKDFKSPTISSFVGNLFFCSPEARDLHSLKSDVFSVGAMFLHLMYPLI